jgi:hypothetical protein
MRTSLLCRSFLFLVPFLVACSSGSDLGTELVREVHDYEATMHHTDAVDPAVANEVFDAMVKMNYNFRSGLPKQIDRVDGRLTLRLGNDNEDTIAAVLRDGEDEGAVNYMHGLAHIVSQAVGGEPVDVILCRKTLDQPYYTVAWTPQ